MIPGNRKVSASLIDTVINILPQQALHFVNFIICMSCNQFVLTLQAILDNQFLSGFCPTSFEEEKL